MKNVQSDEFIWSEQWRRKAHSILRRDGYIDQYILKTTGRMIEANLVHHILPRDEFPQYAMEDWNLISLNKRTHSRIIHTIKGKLTNEGRKLMMETAFKQGIKLHEKILVIGKPGSGKTTWVKDHMGPEALVYDLDHIAAAFRLKEAHAERHNGARRMANALFKAFAARAGEYASRIYLIRTAPTTEELAQIKPDEVILCLGRYDIRRRKDFQEVDQEAMEKRIEDAKRFCELNSIPFRMIPPDLE